MKVKTMMFKNVEKSICFQSLLKPLWKQNYQFIPQIRSWPGHAELFWMSKSSALFMIKETFSSSSLHFYAFWINSCYFIQSKATIGFSWMIFMSMLIKSFHLYFGSMQAFAMGVTMVDNAGDGVGVLLVECSHFSCIFTVLRNIYLLPDHCWHG